MHLDEKFFVAVATIIFVALVFKPMKRALLSMLDARIDKISRDLAEAEKLKSQAEQLLLDAREKLNDSEKQARQMIDFAKEESAKLINLTKVRLERDIEVRKKLAMQKIQSFEEASVADLRKNISHITVAVASQIIDEGSTDEDLRKMIGISLERLSKTVH